MQLTYQIYGCYVLKSEVYFFLKKEFRQLLDICQLLAGPPNFLEKLRILEINSVIHWNWKALSCHQKNSYEFSEVSVNNAIIRQ